MGGQLLLGLSILVIIHELGHFLAARMFGIKVEKFYLFFDAWGFKLFKFKRGDTEYGIGWLPLGGYVKIAGMIDESMDKEFLNKPPQDWEFRSKPTWQRLIVMLGGIIFNLALGILIYWGHTFYYGDSYLPISELKYGISPGSLGKEIGLKAGDNILEVDGIKPTKYNDLINPKLILQDNVKLKVQRNDSVFTLTMPDDFGNKVVAKGLSEFISFRQTVVVNEVTSGSNAEKGGLKDSDKIMSVNGTDCHFYDVLSETLKQNKGKTIVLGVERNGIPKTLNVKVDTGGMLGFNLTNDFKFKTEYHGLLASLPLGINKAWNSLSSNVQGLWRMITGKIPANQVHSFIGIAKFYGPHWDWMSFWAITALLSMVLAFMNLLPIPALDGGHVVFLLVEMIRRKPLSVRFLEVTQTVGFALLMMLMAFAFYNDFAQFVFK